jgi:hypothetical protein
MFKSLLFGCQGRKEVSSTWEVLLSDCFRSSWKRKHSLSRKDASGGKNDKDNLLFWERKEEGILLNKNNPRRCLNCNELSKNANIGFGWRDYIAKTLLFPSFPRHASWRILRRPRTRQSSSGWSFLWTQPGFQVCKEFCHLQGWMH